MKVTPPANKIKRIHWKLGTLTKGYSKLVKVTGRARGGEAAGKGSICGLLGFPKLLSLLQPSFCLRRMLYTPLYRRPN